MLAPRLLLFALACLAPCVLHTRDLDLTRLASSCCAPSLLAGCMLPGHGFNICLGFSAKPRDQNQSKLNKHVFLLVQFLCFGVHVFGVSCNTWTLTGSCCLTCSVFVNVAPFLNETQKLKSWNTLELSCVVHFGSSVLGASCAPTLFFPPRTDTPVFQQRHTQCQCDIFGSLTLAV